MEVVIDPKAGFCGGVKRAIKMVEKALNEGQEIYVRGELIHNEREMERLYEKRLKICEELDRCPGNTLFIRTHGESPDIYIEANNADMGIVDATCRNVRRSQEIISQRASEGRRIYIFGKKLHPEVIGLLGYCKGRGVVFQHPNEIKAIVIDEPSLLIPQTTADPVRFESARLVIEELITDLEVYNAICPFVSQREEELRKFAASFDSIIFVGGRHSSNTAVLFEVCKRANRNAFFVENPKDLPFDKLAGLNSVGISGSASTPMWQLEEIAEAIGKTINKRKIENSLNLLNHK